MGRPKGYVIPLEERQRISETQRKNWERIRVLVAAGEAILDSARTDETDTEKESGPDASTSD